MTRELAVVVGRDVDEWILVKDFTPYTRPDITIPAGFMTDFASIPRFFWRIIPPHGKIKEPAIVHDFWYALDLDKREADDLFLALMKAYDVPWWKRSVAYRAVRMFGSKAKSIEQWKERGLMKNPEQYLET